VGDAPKSCLIAGASSGVGKTSLTLGLARLFSRAGKTVQTFKVGPDYLDPSHLMMASGRPCYNLDGWMCGLDYCRGLFAEKSRDAEFAIVEGVMGLFDGAEPGALQGSSAEIARALGIPVLLVVDASGMAGSVAALAHGYASLHDGVGIAGIIANRVGSARHAGILHESLRAHDLPPLLAAIPKDALPSLQSRHLGLVPAEKGEGLVQADALADALAGYIDTDRLGESCRAATDASPPRRPLPAHLDNVRVGLARDEAFRFHYPDNLEALEAAGVQWVPFSPLHDEELPDGLDALYLAGGYPEIHAETLSRNTRMLQSIRAFSESGRVVYAECGGLMLLSRTLETTDGANLPLTGALPLDLRMLTRRKRLGLAEVTFRKDCAWGSAGQTLRGHEFHYSDVVRDDALDAGWRHIYDVAYRRPGEAAREGYNRGGTLASYVHLHWASRPDAATGFVRACKERA
jgi:cobyrinic acid a,c-diamide synthase